MKSKRYVNKIFKVLSETIKNPTTELNYSDEFTLLVAVVLSAQSTDKGVNKVTTKLFNLAKPILFPNLNKCVSTAIYGLPKNVFKTTFAVFLPTPGSLTKASLSDGTFPSCSLISILLKRNKFLAFEL